MLDLKLYPAKPQNVRWIEKKGLLIILNPRQGLYYKLNKVAALAWLYSNGTRTIEEIIKMILRDYRVSQARLKRDILSLLTYLKSQGLIRVLKDAEEFCPQRWPEITVCSSP